MNKLNAYELEVEFWERTGYLPEEKPLEFMQFCLMRNR